MRSLNLLALDTSTEVLSIAVARGPALLEHTAPGGAQASATLVPAIQALLAQAGLRLQDLQAIAFGRGPGSFTGLRTACAVAQGLGYGADVPLLPVDTLLAVAEDVRHRSGASQVVAVLDARMDQVYSAAWEYAGGAWTAHSPASLGAPEEVVVPAGWVLAGNAVESYGARLPPGERLAAAPTAAALLRLAPVLLATGQGVAAAEALPLYVRDKVAQTTQEREALRRAPGKAEP